MVWDISPIAFSFSLGDHLFNVRWYGLFFASTFVSGILIFHYMFRREGRPKDDVYDLALYVIGGTVAGARLGHVLLYNPQHYFSHPAKIFAVWEGGLASHGAVVGILTAVWLYSRQATGQSFLWICDRIGLAVPLSGCLSAPETFSTRKSSAHPLAFPGAWSSPVSIPCPAIRCNCTRLFVILWPSCSSSAITFGMAMPVPTVIFLADSPSSYLAHAFSWNISKKNRPST